MSKFKDVNDKIADVVVDGYKKIEDGVVGGYKKIEDGVVGGYKKIEDKFVETFLAKEGESAQDAKERMEKEKAEAESKAIEAMNKNL